MRLFQTELGFYQTILLLSALGLIIWGSLYAGSLLVGITWFILISVIALLLYIFGRRLIRRLIHGGGGRS